jgi:glycyl-tRNA synthetase
LPTHNVQAEAKQVLRFTPLVAPVKATVFPLIQKPELNKVARQVSSELTGQGLSNLVDTTGTTIGKRYARTDEIGVPYAITVDPQVAEDSTVTLRERDTTAQVGCACVCVPYDEGEGLENGGGVI